MAGEAFRTAVEQAKETELSRLGSEKLLLALTDADLETETVLTVAAMSEYAAAETFREWAHSESVEIAKSAFEATADQENAHLERITAELETFTPPDSPGPMHAYLQGLEDTIPRVAGGLVGRPLVSLRSHTQVISFFVNEPDPRLADVFRELKTETESELETGLEVLEALCGSDGDLEEAQAVAEYTIQVAYDDYADGIRDLGLDPKPLC